METRSGTGGSLPPVAGHIGPSVVKTRPDLKEMGGYIVRVPRSLDIDMNEDSQRVCRVQAPEDMVVASEPGETMGETRKCDVNAESPPATH